MKELDRIKKQYNESVKSVYGYDNGYQNNEQEIITEGTVYKKGNLYISVYPDNNTRKLIEAPYFKISWVPISRTSTKVARIDMISGDYLKSTHYNTCPEVPKNIENELNKALGSICTVPGYNENGFTVWQVILQQIANNSGIYDLAQLKTIFDKYPQIPINLTKVPSGYTKIKWGK